MLEIIAQLTKVNVLEIEKIASEISSANIDWNEPYPEYASDGLKVATLLNPTGEQNNFDYKDCQAPLKTPLLSKLPSLDTFIEKQGFHIMGSRLLRLDPGTFLHEHRDFVYLQNIPRFRLHVPIITNPYASIITPGRRVHFKKGFIWKLDPKATVHSACNFGDQPRIHLMMDCYLNQPLSALLENQWFDKDAINSLSILSPLEKNQLLDKAQDLLKKDKLKEAEESLLKSFCQYYLGDTTSYDLLFELFEKSTNYKERKGFWQERLKEVYPNTQPVAVPV